MPGTTFHVTLINGPTALLELGGLRLLTDPTFDPAGTEYPTAAYTLRKTTAPTIEAQALPPLDGILLSHDHHFDNLDHLGRRLLAQAQAVYTTVTGAERLSGHAVGLRPWQARQLPLPDGGVLTLTATPGRHGPEGGDRGPVLGFVLTLRAGPTVYVSGDTVWYEGVAQVGRRFAVDIAILNMGAAKVQVAGPEPLTFTAADGIALAQAWPGATILPLHYDGWEHFSEGRQEIASTFAKAGLATRLRWCPPGERVLIAET